MKWISVEDRLPKDYKFKLAVWKRGGDFLTVGTPLMAIYLRGMWRGIGADFGPINFPIEGEVTHWMEFPPLPKERDEVD